MGQINSTRNSGTSTSSSRECARLSSEGTGIPTRPDIQTPAGLIDSKVDAGKPALRKSLRSNIIRLVHPRSSRAAEEGVSQDGMVSRKWWRMAHCWSKIPLVRRTESRGVLSNDTIAGKEHSQRQGLVDSASSVLKSEPCNENNASLPPPNTRSTHDDQASSTEYFSSDFVETRRHAPTTFSKDKERSIEASGDLAEHVESPDNPPSPGSVDTFRDGLSTSTPGSPSSSSGARGATTQRPSIVTDEDGLSSDTFWPAPGHSRSQTASNNSPLRQLPPAGTLIVIQGVVHTNGASRSVHDSPASSLHSPPEQLLFTSNSSTHQRQPRAPGSAEQNSRNSGISLASHASESCTVDGPSDTSAPASGGAGVNDPRSELFEALLPSSVTTSAGPLHDNSQRQSPSNLDSTDALGALLSIVSVATVATAASLLSSPHGRPASLLSSTIQPNMSTGMSPQSPTTESTVPVLARALASANPAAPDVLAQREREREERERRRMRSLWESLRERMTSSRGSRGLPGSGHRLQTLAGPSSRGRVGDGPVIPDSLFSELARAFNLGSSPDERASQAQNAQFVRPISEGNQSSSSQGRDSHDDDYDVLPDSDSFERFLLDLQFDLRVALTRADTMSNVRSTGENTWTEDVGIISRNADATDLEDVSPRNNDVTESSIAHFVHESPRSEEARSLDLPNAEESGTGPNRSSSMPDVLEDITDANLSERNSPSLVISGPEDSSEPNSDSNFGEETNPTVRNASAMSGGNATVNDINWWRIYRFPPMLSIQPRRSDLEHNISDTDAAHSLASNTLNIAGPTGFSTPNSPTLQGSAGTVVPVIVVALQPINFGIRRSTPPPSDSTVQADDETSEGTLETSSPEVSSTRSFAAPQNGHGNRPSRATRAFRRLGQSGDSITDQDLYVPDSIGGARTFFIYVLSGYYPPDHLLLSGPDALDSFEALRELTELLGQVKSPVATDEEIERSGLETFKGRALQEFQHSGRVASNCVDRCLICLDDYNSDDDLRLLFCKHTFHKTCVDRWLKTGCNNCPVCRSKGVKTEHDDASVPPL